MAIGSPMATGCVGKPGMALSDAASEPSELIAIAQFTPLDVIAKIPGPTCPTGNCCGADWTPDLVTTTVALPEVVPAGSTFHGTCALIWPADTKYSPAGMPFIVTETLLSDVESGTVSF